MSTDLAAKQTCDVVVIGEYYCDLIFHDLEGAPELGKEVIARGFDTVPGGSFTPTLSLSRLGVSVLWACGLGTDPYSAFIRNEARLAGFGEALFQELDHPLQRVTSVFSTQGDRGFMTYVDDPDPTADVEAVLTHRPKFILIQGLSSLFANLELVQQARTLGITVISDCGHIEKSIEDRSVRNAIASVDVFMPNAAELLQLTGALDLEEGLHLMGEVVSKVVVKTGAKGALGLNNGQIKRTPAKKVDVFDTTGAGDSFNAGFVYGLLKGKSYEDAMILGGLNGSISTTDLGGRAVPDEAQILAEWNAFHT